MILIGNGRLVTRDSAEPYLNNGAVLIDGGSIKAVGTTADMRSQYPNVPFEDTGGGLIMPGLINAHDHAYSALARGMAINGYYPESFTDILEGLWWKLDHVFTNTDTLYSGYTAFVDCIKNGVTTVFDHHASYGEIDGSLFVLSEAARQVGVRSCLCYEVSDREGKDKMARSVAENISFMKKTEAEKDGMQAGMMGLHASFTLSDESLDYCKEMMPREASCHIHVAEARSDVQDALDKYGKRVVKRLYDRGILGKKTIAAHCVHIDAEEMAILQDSDTIVVHNPESNMSNAVGSGPAVELYQSGVLIGLGTDGYTKDMLESLKVGCLLNKHRLKDTNAATAELTSMLFQNNAAITKRIFGIKTGAIKPGFAADIIVLDYDPPTPMTADNIDGHILFGLAGANVKTTIVNGKVLMRNGVLTELDEAAVRAKSREQAADLWKRVNSETGRTAWSY